jgi:hypothetical protein
MLDSGPPHGTGRSVQSDLQNLALHSVPHAVGLNQLPGATVSNIILPTDSGLKGNDELACITRLTSIGASDFPNHAQPHAIPKSFQGWQPRSHGERYTCRSCNTAFTRGFNLRRHRDTCKFRQVPPQQKATMHSVIPCPVKSCKYQGRKDNVTLHLLRRRHSYCYPCSDQHSAVCPHYRCEDCYFHSDTKQELELHHASCQRRARKADRARAM